MILHKCVFCDREVSKMFSYRMKSICENCLRNILIIKYHERVGRIIFGKERKFT